MFLLNWLFFFLTLFFIKIIQDNIGIKLKLQRKLIISKINIKNHFSESGIQNDAPITSGESILSVPSTSGDSTSSPKRDKVRGMIELNITIY